MTVLRTLFVCSLCVEDVVQAAWLNSKRATGHWSLSEELGEEEGCPRSVRTALWQTSAELSFDRDVSVSSDPLAHKPRFVPGGARSCAMQEAHALHSLP